MNKYLKNSLVSICALLLVDACTKDFIEVDLKDNFVNIVSPVDNLHTPSNTVTFWWDEVDGATKYNLQIVKPSFDSLIILELDTNITINKFTQTLTPGKYQWRVRAYNNSSTTAFFTHSFVVDSTSNLSLTSVSLISPISNTVLATNQVSFTWNSLYSATSYDLKITNVLTGSLVTISGLTSPSYSYSFTTTSGVEEKFKWQVIAYNGFSQTINNTYRSFKIDHKSPLSPAIISPNSYTLSVRDTVELIWVQNSTSTDIYYDEISISTDSTFASVLGTQKFYATLPYPRINAIYSYTGTPQAIWWKVQSVDSVGNISGSTLSKRLYLK